MPKKGHSEEQIIAALKQQERSIASLLFPFTCLPS